MKKFSLAGFKVFNNGNNITFTKIITNSCCCRENTLCVLAVHIPQNFEIIVDSEVTGKFLVTRKYRDGKLPVIHLDVVASNQKANCMYVDFNGGGLHNQTKYTVSKGGGCVIT